MYSGMGDKREMTDNGYITGTEKILMVLLLFLIFVCAVFFVYFLFEI